MWRKLESTDGTFRSSGTSGPEGDMRLTASPITSAFRMTASCNSPVATNVSPPHGRASCATVPARCTRTFTSTREPSRLMIDIRRSTVNRPRSALRMREKSAAAMPVRPCAARTVRYSRSSALMISEAKMAFELLRVCVLVPEVAKHIAASPHQLQLFASHRNISFNLFKGTLSISLAAS